MKKQYRISHTEEKIIELIRDKDALKSILRISKEGSSLRYFVDCCLGNSVFDCYTRNSRWGDNLTVIKRLEEFEYNALIFLRTYKADLFNDISYDDFAEDSPACVKLYNLTTKGVSKTLDTLLDTGFLTKEQLIVLNNILSGNRESVCITGDLNSGKIILLNALLYKLCSEGWRVVVFDESSELQLDFIDDKSRVKVFDDIEKVTLGDVRDLDGYTVVTTDLSSEYLAMFCELCVYSRIYGIYPVSDLGEVDDELLESCRPHVLTTGIKDGKKYLKGVSQYD